MKISRTLDQNEKSKSTEKEVFRLRLRRWYTYMYIHKHTNERADVKGQLEIIIIEECDDDASRTKIPSEIGHKKEALYIIGIASCMYVCVCVCVFLWDYS
jgi:hypothetical protein